MGKELDIKGQFLPCGKINNAKLGAGIISLEECKKCEFHKGVQMVREENKEKEQLEIVNILCNLPTQIRVNYLFEGVN